MNKIFVDMDGIYDESWLSKIIEETKAALNEDKIKSEHRDLSPEELKTFGIYFSDGTKYDYKKIGNTLWYVVKKMLKNGEDASSFYCGITNDLIKRKADHESQDYSGKKISGVIAVKCDSMKTAALVEDFLSTEYGLSRGKSNTFANGAAEDSDFVYIYRIPK